MADSFMDSILEQIPLLNLEDLVKLCDQFQVQVEEAKKDNKPAIKRLFVKYLMSDEVVGAADEGAEMFQRVDAEIAKLLKKGKAQAVKQQKKESETSSTSAMKKEEEVDNKENKEESEESSGDEDEDEDEDKEDKEEKEKEKVQSEEKERLTLLRNLKLREFKITGAVGRSTGCIDYRDLQFQMENGKTQGYKMAEIRSGVIKACKAGSSLKRYFEGSPNISNTAFKKMLRSHYEVEDATTVFNKMVSAYQEPLELATDFVLRMMDMRNDIIMLSKEEDCRFEATFVRKKFVHALSIGFSEDTVRMELRAVLKDHNIEDHELLEEVSIVMQREDEHKKKLKHKYKEVKTSVKEVRDEIAVGETDTKTLISEIKMLTLQVAEMMKVVGNVEEYRQEVMKLRKQVLDMKRDFLGGKDGFSNSGRGGRGGGNLNRGGRGASNRGGGGNNMNAVQEEDDELQNVSQVSQRVGRGGYNNNGRGGFNSRGGSFGSRGGFGGRGGGFASRGGFGGRGGHNNSYQHFVKCGDCEANGQYCTHCSTCGDSQHKRRDCPLNE